MSQMGKFISLASLNALGTLTGNVGAAVSGDITANIDFVGTDPITVTGTPASNLLTITVADAAEAQKGVAELSTDAEAIAGTSTDTLIVPSSLLAKLGTQTANTIPYGAGTAGAFSWTAAGTDGQLVIAATGLAPAFATLTSSSGFIKFTTGANTLDLDVGAAVAVSFAGDSGTATPALGVLRLTGGNNITTSASGSTVTFNVTGTTEFAVQVGSTSGSLADVAVGATNQVLLGNTAAAPTWGQVDLTTDVTGILPVPNGGSGAATFTDFGVLLGSGASAFSITAVGATNQVLLGTTGADPVWGQVDLTTDVTGTLPVPAGGTGAVPFAAHGLLVGSGAGALSVTAVGATNQVLLGSTAADPVWGQVDLTADVTGTLPVPEGGTGATSLTDGGIVLGSGTGAVTVLGQALNGEIPIGNTGADPVLATITAGSNITVTNGTGTITIAASGGGGGMTWTEVTGTSQSMAVDTGYILNNAGLVTATLPDTAAVGDIVAIVGSGAGGWKLAQNAGETIHFVSSDTTTGAGGSLASTNRYDGVELICTIANTDWVVRNSVGNLTIV